jgi:uncharacterized protein (TIGR02246 family)
LRCRPSPSKQARPIQQLREQLLAHAKKFEYAWNNNDAPALAALFTKNAILLERSEPISGREAIEKHYKELFQNIHFSNNHGTYVPESPHAIGTDGKAMWETVHGALLGKLREAIL